MKPLIPIWSPLWVSTIIQFSTQDIRVYSAWSPIKVSTPASVSHSSLTWGSKLRLLLITHTKQHTSCSPSAHLLLAFCSSPARLPLISRSPSDHLLLTLRSSPARLPLISYFLLASNTDQLSTYKSQINCLINSLFQIKKERHKVRVRLGVATQSSIKLILSQQYLLVLNSTESISSDFNYLCTVPWRRT